MEYISDFADSAITLPLVAAIWGVLALLGNARLISKWALCVMLVWCVMLVLKALSFVLTAGDPDGMASPSGHTASACIVYGGLAWLLLRHHAPMTAVLAPVALTVLIGISRVAIAAHSVGEVIAGAAIGAAGLLGLALWAEPASRLRAAPIVLISAFVIGLLHGTTLPVERQLQAIVLRP
jgi:membrane-associated phospholipid phosphatase